MHGVAIPVIVEVGEHVAALGCHSAMRRPTDAGRLLDTSRRRGGGGQARGGERRRKRGHAQDEGQIRPADDAVGRAVPGEDLYVSSTSHVGWRNSRPPLARGGPKEAVKPVKVAGEVGRKLK